LLLLCYKKTVKRYNFFFNFKVSFFRALVLAMDVDGEEEAAAEAAEEEGIF
jgi:hypothetical protein